MQDEGSSRPMAWIAATGVLALVAIGFAIWGFSKKSDLDDANKTISNQQAQLSGQESAASSKEKSEAVYSADTLHKYDQVRKSLVGSEVKESDSQKEIETQLAQLKQARAQVASAKSADDKAKAELNKSQQETDLAAACAQGTITVINDFFSSGNASRGAQRSMNKLEKLEPQCQEVLGGN